MRGWLVIRVMIKIIQMLKRNRFISRFGREAMALADFAERYSFSVPLAYIPYKERRYLYLSIKKYLLSVKNKLAPAEEQKGAKELTEKLIFEVSDREFADWASFVQFLFFHPGINLRGSNNISVSLCFIPGKRAGKSVPLFHYRRSNRVLRF